MLESFLKLFYSSKGVIAENENTWERTTGIHPFQVFADFKVYANSIEVRSLYGDLTDTMISNIGEYMSPEGSESHMFTKEYQLDDIMQYKTIRFDFGLLESGRSKSDVSFKVRVDFMNLINAEYSRVQKKKGNWVIKVLEESQVAEDYLLKIYVEEMTLRRAQNQITVLLGNSTSALENNPIARPLLDNINILVIGSVPKSSREFLVKEYGLEDHEYKLENIFSMPDYENTFLLVNRMKKNSTTALLKAFVPSHISKGKIFKNVDVEEQG